MKNKNLPASSLGNAKLGLADVNPTASGLTKLEYAAIHICASLAVDSSMSHEDAALHASTYAQALFEELEKELEE